MGRKSHERGPQITESAEGTTGAERWFPCRRVQS